MHSVTQSPPRCHFLLPDSTREPAPSLRSPPHPSWTAATSLTVSPGSAQPSTAAPTPLSWRNSSYPLPRDGLVIRAGPSDHSGRSRGGPRCQLAEPCPSLLDASGREESVVFPPRPFGWKGLIPELPLAAFLPQLTRRMEAARREEKTEKERWGQGEGVELSKAPCQRALEDSS